MPSRSPLSIFFFFFFFRACAPGALALAFIFGRTFSHVCFAPLAVDVINTYDDEGLSPLSLAALAGDGEALIWLINNGAAVNAFDPVQSWTALHWAVFARQVQWEGARVCACACVRACVCVCVRVFVRVPPPFDIACGCCPLMVYLTLAWCPCAGDLNQAACLLRRGHERRLARGPERDGAGPAGTRPGHRRHPRSPDRACERT